MNRSLPLLVLVVGILGWSVTLGAQVAAAEGPASLGKSAWQSLRPASYVDTPTLSSPSPIHGDIRYYSYAPAIPASGDAGWQQCGASSVVCPNADSINMHLTSRLPGGGCFEYADFTFFQSMVSVPAGTAVTEFSIVMSGADDGARVSLFNSLYPAGLVLNPGSYIFLGGAQTTTNLKDYVAAGEINRVVITQVDDCPTENNLDSAVISLNGNVLPTLLTPTVATAIHNAAHATVTSVATGTVVHDSVTVTGSGATPSGNVTVTWFANGTCDGTPAATSSAAALAGGSVDVVAFTQTPVAGGTYAFRASYEGDATYQSADGPCEPLTVTSSKLTPTVVSTIHDAAHAAVGSVLPGTTVHDRALVSGTGAVPTGTVTVSWFTNSSCTGAASATSGTTTLASGAVDVTGFPQTPAVAGHYAFRVSYSGDAAYDPATGPCEPLTVTSATDGDGTVVTICHVPPGNPAAAHTIVVGTPALQAHLRHGDYEGPCGSGVPSTAAGSVKPGHGRFHGKPVFSSAQFAQAVFAGGSEAEFEAALSETGATGAWTQDASGDLVLYIVRGGFVNGKFKTAHPSGFATPAAVILVGGSS